MYSRVHGALIRNDLDDAQNALEDIVRRLKAMESGEDILETSLILNSQYESLYADTSDAYFLPPSGGFLLRYGFNLCYSNQNRVPAAVTTNHTFTINCIHTRGASNETRITEPVSDGVDDGKGCYGGRADRDGRL